MIALNVILICLVALVSSWLSGVFGMAGGVIFIFALIQVFSLGTAILIHSTVQSFTNGMRALLDWQHIHWPIVWPYLLGNLIALIFFWQFNLPISKELMIFSLGGIAVLTPIFKTSPIKLNNFTTTMGVGLFIGSLQFATGVAGPLFNVFFLDTAYSKNQVVATKSVISAVSHILKLLFFLPLILREEVPAEVAPLLPLLLVLGCAGTQWGQRSREKISEQKFLFLSRYIISGLGLFMLGKWAFG